jgi:hypothetical protein
MGRYNCFFGNHRLFNNTTLNNYGLLPSNNSLLIGGFKVFVPGIMIRMT